MLQEIVYWKILSAECMSEESDGESNKIRHTPKWRSERLNNFIRKLDERNQKRLGRNTNRVCPRVYGELRDVAPPENLPCWMLAPGFQQTPVTPPTNIEAPLNQDSRTPFTPLQPSSYEPMYEFSLP